MTVIMYSQLERTNPAATRREIPRIEQSAIREATGIWLATITLGATAIVAQLLSINA